MKRNQLLVLSALVFGLQGVAQASPYPADAEASLGLPGIETVAFAGNMHAQASSYPADAEASLGLPGEGDRATAWGVSAREGKSNDPFPVGFGFTAE